MFTVVACITRQHDLRLVVLAGVICTIASFTTMKLIGAAMTASGRARAAWIAGSAVAVGSGIWATHFIAMLAFQPHMPIVFELLGTIASLAVAILGSAIGLYLYIRNSSRLAAVISGLVIGVTIGAMHYSGMAAARIAGHIVWNAELVAASIVIGCVLAAAAMVGARVLPGAARTYLPPLILVLAICGLHFTGMAAATLVVGGEIPRGWDELRQGYIAIAVALVTTIILSLSLVAVFVDRQFARAAERDARRLRQLADATFEGIVIRTGATIRDVNDAFRAMIGADLDALIGHSILEFLSPESQEVVRRRLSAGEFSTIELELVRADGEILIVEVLSRQTEYEGEAAYITAVRDVTERKRVEERMRHMAHHDVLTGLANRALFHGRLSQSLAQAGRGPESVCVLCLDLDQFKAANDLLGHQGGDELLKEAARRICEAVRDMDTVARLGGDEFAIIQPGVRHPEGGAILAERIVKSLSEPFFIAGQHVIIGVSIGIASYPQDASDEETLLSFADMALYRAKEAGRGTYRFYEAGMDQKLLERREMERDLRYAIANDGLKVFYQPLFNCEGQVAIRGFEALLRWSHPTRGDIPPLVFIPLAEETGLIMPLGKLVLEKACAEAASWRDEHRIAVNLSPAQFKHPNLAGMVSQVLAETGLDPDRLELEVTESLLIDDTDRALATLNAFRAMGIHISLDDFGTGYSSLSYLHRFPFDKIKIDSSFIQTLTGNEGSADVVRAIIALARSLKLEVTAEGVESTFQFDLLRAQQCDQIQGFLLGRPMPAEEIEDFVRKTALGVDLREAS